MTNKVKNNLSMLRDRMTKAGGDICLITDNDPHISEYTGDHYKVRDFFSGFTGSAGTLVVGSDHAWLFTDGRYFVQAVRELDGSGIILMKSGTPGVPGPVEFIKQQADIISKEKHRKVSFYNKDNITRQNTEKNDENKKQKPDQDVKTVVLTDGSLLKASDGISLNEDKNIELHDDFDPAEGIWTNRPARKNNEIFTLDVTFTGETSESKLKRIREKTEASGCAYHIIGSLEDIAWILNLRGSDIACTPVFEAFLVIGEETVLFVNEAALSENALNVLKTAKVSTQKYDSIYDYVSRICTDSCGCIQSFPCGQQEKNRDLPSEDHDGFYVLIDSQRVNYKIISSLPDGAVKNGENPSVLMRAVKNETEIRHLRQVHEDDGLCVSRLMYMIKRKISADRPWTEADAADHIDALREEIPDHVSLSFPTISAFGANAAMMHYAFDRDNCATVSSDTVPGSDPQKSNCKVTDTREDMLGAMLLVDSGGQYIRGTTDVTRTFAVGEVPLEQKEAYTLALKGLLALSDAVFLKGTSGYGLDILARQFLWHEGVDYRCGTGHGVGYMLNVHEGPNAFRYKYVPGTGDYCELEPGMVTTCEPGVYEEGRFGLRIENELLCVKAFENEYGEFLRFDTLTLVPYDRDLIITGMLTEHERKLVDEYHKRVYEVLSPGLDGAEKDFLREYTDKLS